MASQTTAEPARKPEDSVYVGRALPVEYGVVLDNMPKEWFGSSPHVLQLEVAQMIRANRFVIAQRGNKLLGGIGWQEDVAYGAFYSKFLFVLEGQRGQGVAVRLMREVLTIANAKGARAVFGDYPEDSTLRRVVDEIPGAREVGYIDDFHEDGVKSIVVQFDLRNYERLLRQAERMLEKKESSD